MHFTCTVHVHVHYVCSVYNNYVQYIVHCIIIMHVCVYILYINLLFVNNFGEYIFANSVNCQSVLVTYMYMQKHVLSAMHVDDLLACLFYRVKHRK